MWLDPKKKPKKQTPIHLRKYSPAMSRNVVVFGDAQESGVTLAFTPRRDGFGWAMILSEAQARNANKVCRRVQPGPR